MCLKVEQLHLTTYYAGTYHIFHCDKFPGHMPELLVHRCHYTLQMEHASVDKLGTQKFVQLLMCSSYYEVFHEY